jgi:hypothetical protein
VFFEIERLTTGYPLGILPGLWRSRLLKHSGKMTGGTICYVFHSLC